MTHYPDGLTHILEDFDAITDRNERAQYLIEIADRFDEFRVPPSISIRPHSEEHRIQHCESDAYVWVVDQPDGTQRYYFDVLNPQGLSAMAISVILGENLSNQPLKNVAIITSDIVLKIFGKEISMGKGQGLMSIVNRVTAAAKTRLQK